MGLRDEGKMFSALRVFIGYDKREDDAYRVATHTLKKYTSIPLAISKLDQPNLRERGLYYRPENEPASTAFAHTRFLVPALTNFQGYALFFDCDFMWTKDVAKLVDAAIAAGRDKAVWCVQHDYVPHAKFKMDGQPQVAYPLKNWSSLMLFNCGHPSVQEDLTIEKVNTHSTAWLHRFSWCGDDEIGALPQEWNWLEGEYDWPDGAPLPGAVHYTNGGPWHPGYGGVRFHSRWRHELEAAKRGS